MAEPNYAQYLSAGLRANRQGIALGAWRAKAPNAVPLHAGFPFQDSFPIQDIVAACAAVMEREGTQAMQYGGGPAAAALKEYLLARSQARGLCSYPSDVLITSGSSHALDLICHAFLDPGDVLGVEAPTFMGAVAIFRNYTTNFLPVPIDEHGCRVDVLSNALAARRQAGQPLPKLFYVIPNYHNPGGVTMALERRQALLELAGEYDFLIIEDDAYGSLGFDGPPPPSLRAMDAEGRVIYCSTLSKLVGPGMRVGWVVANPAVTAVLNRVKTDGANPFAYSVCSEYLRQNDLDRRVEWLKAEYKQRCTALLTSLERHMPPGCSWTRPQGGFFVWVTFPDGVDMAAALAEANERGVAYIPGRYFFTDGSGANCARLSFSFASADEMDRGVRALAEVISARVR